MKHLQVGLNGDACRGQHVAGDVAFLADADKSAALADDAFFDQFFGRADDEISLVGFSSLVGNVVVLFFVGLGEVGDVLV